jgi:hypothetical protein
MKALRDLERQWKKGNGTKNVTNDHDTVSVYEFKLTNDVESEQQCFMGAIKSLNPHQTESINRLSKNRRRQTRVLSATT